MILTWYLLGSLGLTQQTTVARGMDHPTTLFGYDDDEIFRVRKGLGIGGHKSVAQTEKGSYF